MSFSTGQIIPEVLEALGANSEQQLQAVVDLTKTMERLWSVRLLEQLPASTQAELMKLAAKGQPDRVAEKVKTLFATSAVNHAQKEASEKVLHDYFEHMFARMNEKQRQAVGHVLEKYQG